ncbi:Transposase IS4 [Popillia japonica]|uniref:Transposase IS4 n=1 Tax=Popillia japonica TaxID=7064 RepID=A0AAW1N815_POPJA
MTQLLSHGGPPPEADDSTVGSCAIQYIMNQYSSGFREDNCILRRIAPAFVRITVYYVGLLLAYKYVFLLYWFYGRVYDFSVMGDEISGPFLLYWFYGRVYDFSVMGDEISGPSRPKRRLTDYEKKRPLTLAQQEALLYLSESDEEPFVGSESEYELDDTSSSEEEEDVEDIPPVDQRRTNTNLENQVEIPSWGDDPNFKDLPFLGKPGLKINLESDEPMDFFSLFLTDDLLENIVTETNRCLHFSKNPERGDLGYGDRLSKIRWLQDFFNQRIDEIYYPNKNLSLDESMVLWRGRLIFRQYIKNKKHKFGVKLYILSEPNGLVLKARMLYTGAEKDMQGELGHSANVVISLVKKYFENGHSLFNSANVVISLVKKYFENGHSLFTDNYYNSVSLCKELLLRKTYVTGTLRQNRKGNSREVTSKKLKKGEVTMKYSSGVRFGKWRDKREVLFISTEFDGELANGENRRGEQKR